MITDSNRLNPSTRCHPTYEEYLPVWDKITDCLLGASAIKSKRELYLPMTEGMKADSVMGEVIYKRYLHNAMFPDYAQDFFIASTGLLKQKDPTVNFPDAMVKEFKNSPSYNINESLDDIYSTVQDEVMKYSRCGVLLDPPDTGYRSNATYPVLLIYNTYRIINWGVTKYHGREIVSWILLNESYFDSSNESFSDKYVESYRFLGLKTTDSDGNDLPVPIYYTYEYGNGIQGVFNPPPPDENGYATVGDVLIRYPHINGKYMDKIPFFCFTGTRMSLAPERPITQSLCEACISLYGLYADYREYLYKQGFGILFGRGFTTDTTIYSGVNKAVTVADKDADLKMVESSGNGLAEYRLAIDNTMNYAKSLGLAILKGNGDETGVSVAKRQGFKTASLKSIAKTLAEGFTLVSKTAAEWAGLSREEIDSITIIPNTDFSSMASINDLTVYQNIQDANDPIMSDYDVYLRLRNNEITSLATYDEWKQERIRSRAERDKYVLDKKMEETRRMNEESLKQEMKRQEIMSQIQSDASSGNNNDDDASKASMNPKIDNFDIPDAKGKDDGDMRKGVICVETGKQYDSVAEAAKSVGVNSSTIVKQIRGQISYAGKSGTAKLHWKYI